MKQRLAIAGALLMPRELLILDEPTNGLDPQGTREVRNLVASLAGDGITVLVSSHLLSEIEQIYTHIEVLNRGRLVAQFVLLFFIWSTVLAAQCLLPPKKTLARQ